MPLLRQHNGKLIVNADKQVLNLIHETKWMIRLKLEIPETAELILTKEKQFKHYKIHLEQCLQDYTEVLKFLELLLRSLLKEKRSL